MANITVNCATGETIVEPLTQEELIEDAIYRLRAERNKRLSQSDVYVMPDRWDNYTYDQKEAWSNYRQALRDIPETTQDPFNPVWPTKPE